MRGAICAIFIVILSENYKWQCTFLRLVPRQETPRFGFRVGSIWYLTGYMETLRSDCCSADQKTDLYFGIAKTLALSERLARRTELSALGGDADLAFYLANVRFWPLADIANCT